ncbi:MAG: TVP38/TMEM64 family protein [Acidobacteriota bacterium]
MAEERKAKPAWLKLVAAVGVIVVLVLVANHFGLFDMLKQGTLKEKVERLDAMFKGLGAWAPAVLILIWIVASIVMLPGLPIAVASGLVFGAVWGSVYSTIGANLGAILAFLIGRYAARDMVAGWIEKNKALKKIDEGVKQQGWRMLMITRLVPIFPFNIQNYVYGLTKISLGTYALVTLICMIPGTVAFHFAAGSAREVILSGGQPEAIKRTLFYLAIAAIAFVLLSLIPGWVKKRYGSAVVDSAPKA